VEVRAAVAADVSELARLWREFSAYYAELDPERFKVPARLPELESARRLVVDDGYAPTSVRYRKRLR
jgi:hypothetical protein